MTMRQIQLVGRIFLVFDIKTITGLHIGGSPGTLAIGNVDNPVIRNPFTRQPYVPGSSLRGKMRSQLEKTSKGIIQNKNIGTNVTIHVCEDEKTYKECNVCRIFGVPAKEFTETSRLIVRDADLTSQSKEKLESIRTDLPYTEVKWEAAIDRVTSAATPRQQERVPAGAVFRGSIVFNLYSLEDLTLFTHVIDSLRLVEEDFLGGQGSRGSGQVRFTNLTLETSKIISDSIKLELSNTDNFFENLASLRKQWQTFVDSRQNK